MKTPCQNKEKQLHVIETTKNPKTVPFLPCLPG